MVSLTYANRRRFARWPAAAGLALAAIGFESLASANDLLLLNFWSPTCGPCMQMKPVVQALINAGYPIRQIDASRDRHLVEQYRVTHLPCFIMLAGGQEVERLVGSTSGDRLAQMFQRGRTQSPDSMPATRPPTAPAVTVTGPTPPLPEKRWPPQDRAASADTKPLPAVPVEPIDAVPAHPGRAADSTSQFAPNLLAATVRLRVEDANGNSFGTGTIIDARQGEALIITCGHLFRSSAGKGNVMVDLFEAGPEGVRVVGKVPGRMISYDLDRDIALLSIRPNRPVKVAPLAPPQTVVARGDRVASIGCSHGEDPTILATRVTSIDRYHGPPNIEASGAPVEGRSGGGLFNLQGQLIGVCFAADYEGNEGLYAGLESIHGELERRGLKEILGKSSNLATISTPEVVRGQEDSAVVAIADHITPVAANEVSPPVSQSLAAAEEAALEEIARRAATHEVICIIRPKEPGAQSEVITLDSVSPAFIRLLEGRRRQAGAATVR